MNDGLWKVPAALGLVAVVLAGVAVMAIWVHVEHHLFALDLAGFAVCAVLSGLGWVLIARDRVIRRLGDQVASQPAEPAHRRSLQVV